MTELPDLYTLKWVAEHYNFSLRTLQRDARAGKFAHVQRGRTRLMTAEQIKDLIKASFIGGKSSGRPENEAAKVEALRKVLSRSRA